MADSDSIKLCECGCGKPAPIAKYSDKRWGCVKGEPLRFILGHNHIKHGHTSRSGGMSSTYSSWVSMRSRCYDPDATGYKNYGGRGIRVCERWLQFQNFLADMGERPPLSTLDRIDNHSDYGPNNCRWSTRSEQASNRRDAIRITHDGETANLAAWAKKLGIHKATLLSRYWRGERPPTLFRPPEGRYSKMRAGCKARRIS